MSLESAAVIFVIGLVAGILFRVLIKKGSMGMIGDILVGISGAYIIAFMLPAIGISIMDGIQGVIILAVAGSVVALWGIRKAKTA